MSPPYSTYSETDPDNDLPNGRQFNDMRAIRRNNRRKAAEALPKFTTRANLLDEIEGIMNTNINRYYEEGLDKEYARLEAELRSKREWLSRKLMYFQ